MADFVAVNGLSLPPESFGQGTPGGRNEDGTWFPKLYDGDFGDKGYHLDFADSGNLGKDVSGNGNHFTLKQVSTTSAVQNSDVPTAASSA